MCQRHLNTVWSTLLDNSLSIPPLLYTSSFLASSNHDTPTKLLKHFKSRFTFLLPALFIPQVSETYPRSLRHTTGLCDIPQVSATYKVCRTITKCGAQLLLHSHFFALIPSPLSFSTISAPSTLCTLYSFCVPHPFHILHPLPQYLKQSTSSNCSPF